MFLGGSASRRYFRNCYELFEFFRWLCLTAFACIHLDFISHLLLDEALPKRSNFAFDSYLFFPSAQQALSDGGGVYIRCLQYILISSRVKTVRIRQQTRRREKKQTFEGRRSQSCCVARSGAGEILGFRPLRPVVTRRIFSQFCSRVTSSKHDGYKVCRGRTAARSAWGSRSMPQLGSTRNSSNRAPPLGLLWTRLSSPRSSSRSSPRSSPRCSLALARLCNSTIIDIS